MHRWQQTTLALGLTLTATPTVAQDKFEIPLGSLAARDGSSMITHNDNSARMSFGPVGLDSHAGDSRRHQYFNIPAHVRLLRAIMFAPRPSAHRRRDR